MVSEASWAHDADERLQNKDEVQPWSASEERLQSHKLTLIPSVFFPVAGRSPFKTIDVGMRWVRFWKICRYEQVPDNLFIFNLKQKKIMEVKDMNVDTTGIDLFVFSPVFHAKRDVP